MLAEMFRKDAETEPNCAPIGTPDYRRLAAEIASTLTLARSEFTSDANLDVVELELPTRIPIPSRQRGDSGGSSASGSDATPLLGATSRAPPPSPLALAVGTPVKAWSDSSPGSAVGLDTSSAGTGGGAAGKALPVLPRNSPLRRPDKPRGSSAASAGMSLTVASRPSCVLHP